MKNAVFLLYGLLLSAPFAHAAPEATNPPDKTVSDGNVSIRVTKLPDTLEGFRLFLIDARNGNDAKRSVNAKIFLRKTNEPKAPRGAGGDCTLFVELKPYEEKQFNKQCKAKNDADAWEVEIVRIYEF